MFITHWCQKNSLHCSKIALVLRTKTGTWFLGRSSSERFCRRSRLLRFTRWNWRYISSGFFGFYFLYLLTFWDFLVSTYLLPFVQVAKFNRRDDIKTLEVSYADTFDELKTKAFELLHITKDQRDTSQILVEKSENDFEAISEKLTSGLDSILRMDMVFYVDDGSKSLRSSSRSMDELNGNARRSGTYYGSA